jgi:hypothetical protein
MGKGGGSCSSSETVRLQGEERSRIRAQKEQADTERAEQERIANLPRMSVNFISPPPDVKFEFNVEETVGGALGTVAPHYGVYKANAGLLKLEFSETILTREQQLTAAGLCDESQCCVLGVEAVLAGYETVLETRRADTRKAKAMDIVATSSLRKLQFICQYAPEKVNDTNRASCCCTPTHC